MVNSWDLIQEHEEKNTMTAMTCPGLFTHSTEDVCHVQLTLGSHGFCMVLQCLVPRKLTAKVLAWCRLCGDQQVDEN